MQPAPESSSSAAPEGVSPHQRAASQLRACHCRRELTAAAGSSLHHRTLRCTRGFVAASEDSLLILRTRRGSRELVAGPED